MELPAAGITEPSKVSSTDRVTTGPLLHAILDSLPAQIAVIDHTGVITYINEAWKKFARENGAPDLKHSGVDINCRVAQAR